MFMGNHATILELQLYNTPSLIKTKITLYKVKKNHGFINVSLS